METSNNSAKERHQFQSILPSSWMAMVVGRKSAVCHDWPVTRLAPKTCARIIRSCVELGIKYLSIYAFSTENWGRPKEEVEGLLKDT